MNDRDDFAELLGKFVWSWLKACRKKWFFFLASARTVVKSSSLHFNGRIRYGTKGERVEERLLVINLFIKSFYFIYLIQFLVYGCNSNLHLLNKNSRQSNSTHISTEQFRCDLRFRSNHNSIFLPLKSSNVYLTRT